VGRIQCNTVSGDSPIEGFETGGAKFRYWLDGLSGAPGRGAWSVAATQNCHSAGAGGHSGSGCQPFGGVQFAVGTGHPGGALNW
jgi:hypothetical protein